MYIFSNFVSNLENKYKNKFKKFKKFKIIFSY